MVSCETLIETENYCCAPRFSLIASCFKIVDSQASFTKSESEIFERSGSDKILEVRESDIVPPTLQPWFQLMRTLPLGIICKFFKTGCSLVSLYGVSTGLVHIKTIALCIAHVQYLAETLLSSIHRGKLQ